MTESRQTERADDGKAAQEQRTTRLWAMLSGLLTSLSQQGSEGTGSPARRSTQVSTRPGVWKEVQRADSERGGGRALALAASTSLTLKGPPSRVG